MFSSFGLSILHLGGYAPALPTPFRGDGMLDLEAFEQICQLQLRAGAAALVVCGTTGEAPTLTRSEQVELVRVAVRAARGRVPVIAGAGSNATRHAIELTRDAEAAGADAVLSVVPYYNKPLRRGSTRISARLRRGPVCPSFSMMCRLAPCAGSRTIRSYDYGRKQRNLSDSRMRRAT